MNIQSGVEICGGKSPPLKMLTTQEKADILDKIREIVKEIRDLEKQVVDLWYYIADNEFK